MGEEGDIPLEKRVFKVNIVGNEASISRQIDLHLAAIKDYFGVTDNNRIAILCRTNVSLSKINKSLKTPHKLFEETLLDRENSEWGRLFRELLISYIQS